VTNPDIISQEQMLVIAVLLMQDQGKTFRKFTKVWAKRATGGEKITTITSDGVETYNQAAAGDYIVKNQTRAEELYVLKANKFHQRYEYQKDAADGFTQYHPLGKVIAIQMTQIVLTSQKLEKQFLFMAPWGHPQICKQDDFLVCPPDYHEVYRIAKQEFMETYKLEAKL